MKFMMMVKCPADQTAPPSPELMAAVDKLAQEGMKNGTIVEIGGLLPPAMGAVVRVAGGKVTITDGPFAEAKEVIGGYCIAELASHEEARKMAKDFMQMHVDILGAAWQGDCEVRPMAAHEIAVAKR